MLKTVANLGQKKQSKQEMKTLKNCLQDRHIGNDSNWLQGLQEGGPQRGVVAFNVQGRLEA